ncbi:MAG: hypothetical protein AAF203_04930 [Pseudomonadota bacterium]
MSLRTFLFLLSSAMSTLVVSCSCTTSPKNQSSQKSIERKYAEAGQCASSDFSAFEAFIQDVHSNGALYENPKSILEIRSAGDFKYIAKNFFFDRQSALGEITCEGASHQCVSVFDIYRIYQEDVDFPQTDSLKVSDKPDCFGDETSEQVLTQAANQRNLFFVQALAAIRDQNIGFFFERSLQINPNFVMDPLMGEKAKKLIDGILAATCLYEKSPELPSDMDPKVVELFLTSRAFFKVQSLEWEGILYQESIDCDRLLNTFQ